MQSKRFKKYLEARKKSGNTSSGESVRKDKKTDQDFPGYPHGTASEEVITPKSKTERKTAAIDIKDGEKIISKKTKKPPASEDKSDGSANAFEGTEQVSD